MKEWMKYNLSQNKNIEFKLKVKMLLFNYKTIRPYRI